MISPVSKMNDVKKVESKKKTKYRANKKKDKDNKYFNQLFNICLIFFYSFCDGIVSYTYEINFFENKVESSSNP